MGLPRHAARHNMEYVVAAIAAALRAMSGRKLVPAKVAFALNRNSNVREFEAMPSSQLSGRVWRAEHRVSDISRGPPPSVDHRRSEAAPRPPASVLAMLPCDGAER